MPDRTSGAMAGSDETGVLTITVRMPDPRRDGILDVITLRGLARAIRVLRGEGTAGDFDRAFAKIVNLNGAIAQVIQHGRG